MAESARDKLIATAAALFQKQGVRATGLSEILKISQTPKGSLYYYFPHGKAELTKAAIAFAGAQSEDRVQTTLANEPDPTKAFTQLFEKMAADIAYSGHLNHVSISLIALETIDEPELQSACAQVYSRLELLYTSKLIEVGIKAEVAQDLGQFIQSATEGAVTIAATRQQPDLLLKTSDQITRLIRLAIKQAD